LTEPVPPAAEAAARAFFHERLVKAAEQLRARGVKFLEPDLSAPAEGSAYVPCPSGTLELQDWCTQDLERRLARMWESQGLPELAELAGPLLELARLQAAGTTTDAEVSPFIYVMF